MPGFIHCESNYHLGGCLAHPSVVRGFPEFPEGIMGARRVAIIPRGEDITDVSFSNCEKVATAVSCFCGAGAILSGAGAYHASSYGGVILMTVGSICSAGSTAYGVQRCYQQHCSQPESAPLMN